LLSALQQHRSYGEQRGIALTLAMLGNAALDRGDLKRALVLYNEAAPRLQDLGNPSVVVALFNSSVAAMELGNTDRALALASECEEHANASQQPLAAATATAIEAIIQARCRHDSPAAQRLIEALDVLRPMKGRTLAMLLLNELGHLMLDQRKTTEAHGAFQEAIELAYAGAERLRLARALEGFARCLSNRHPERAVRIAAAVDHLRQVVRAVPFPSDRQRLAGWLVPARRKLGKVAYQRAWQHGWLLGIDEAVALARAVQLRENENQSSAILTPRERQVAMLLARGLATRQIAADLVISPATVAVHMEHILGKLGLHSRAQVAVWALQNGHFD
jgi:DNA-binding CsgD family transcriptional regulator